MHQPPLLPQPHAFTPVEGNFRFNAATALHVELHLDNALMFSAQSLLAAIEAETGLKLLVTTVSEATEQFNTISLRVHQHAFANKPQSYQLHVRESGIVVTASDGAGLFYGVQTLIQLVRIHGRRVPCYICEDAPALLERGVMLDVSRGRVPTLPTLLQLVETLAHYKINQFQLYTEHTFRFPSHPRIGENTGSLNADDMRTLDAFCRERFITLVPNLQSTGHMRHITSLPEYEHLAESDWRWSITPEHEETYALLNDMYSDLLPAFSAPVFNVDSDEAWDFGRGKAKARSAEVGYGRVYLDHILKLRDLAARHGRQIMIWADVFHHHPELIPEIPDDVILLDWEYEARDSYPTLEALAHADRPFYVCPGTSSWNTIFPRIDNALGNIRNFVRQGIAAGARGMLLTDWGDMGHYQPLGHSWHAYLFGAEMAWSGATTATETFDQAFGRLFLGDMSGRAVEAIRRLGRAIEQESLAFPNRSDVVYGLYQEPLAGRLHESVPTAVLAELIAAADEAMTAWAALPNPTLRHELLFSAAQIVYAATKIQTGQDIRRTLRELAAHETTSEGVARLDALIARLEHGRAELPPMISEFEQLWLRSSQRSEIHINLERYANLLARYETARAWLQAQRDAYLAGGTLDAELATYDHGAYLVLWDESHQDLRRLVESVGPEAVPPEILRWINWESVAG